MLDNYDQSGITHECFEIFVEDDGKVIESGIETRMHWPRGI